MTTIKNIIYCLLLTLLGFSSCKEKDSSKELLVYYTHISFDNDHDIDVLLSTLEKCGTANPETKELKQVVSEINQLQKSFSQKVDTAESIEGINEISLTYLNSLRELTSYQHVIAKVLDDIKSIESNKNASLKEYKIMIKTNMVLVEKEVRDNLLGQWAIDCY